MQIKFNPIYDKKPRGASVEGEKVKFTLRLYHSFLCDQLDFVQINDRTNEVVKKKMLKTEENEDFSTYEIETSFDCGIYWYHFEIMYMGRCTYVVQDLEYNGILSQSLTTSFTQIVTKKTKAIESAGLIYHIFVDRFCKVGAVKVREGFTKRRDWGGELQKNTTDPVKLNQEVFCGNLQGVISKLDYLKSLGVDTIYFSPIFTANSYHKYDTADYEEIDPMLGGNKTFKKLIEEAKKRNISVLLDGVFNHTGSDSIYFNKGGRYGEGGAYNSKKSKFFDWYNFSDWPNKYDSWWGISTLPAVNDKNENFSDFITGKKGVIANWLNTGIKGFRLDVADELSNEFLHKIYNRIKAFGQDKLVLGEVWEDASIKSAYGVRKNYFTYNLLDSVMNYPLKNGILSYIRTGDERDLVRNIYMLLDHYPKNALSNLMNIVGTHDTRRIATVIDEVAKDEDKKFALLKVATLIQFGFPGVPSLFYGDERGVKGGSAPLCRVCFPWEKVDTKQEKWYKFLGKLRKQNVLKKGDFNLVFAGNGVVVFERCYKNQKLVFASNLSDFEFEIKVSKAKELISNEDVEKDYILKSNKVAVFKIIGEK